MATRIVDVLTPVALDQAFSYVVPSNLSLVNGDVVRVPFGTRETVGVVWEIRDGPGGASNLKQVKELAAMPRLAVPLMKFIDWVARYTLAPRGAVLRMAAGMSGRLPVRRLLCNCRAWSWGRRPTSGMDPLRRCMEERSPQGRGGTL